MGGKSETGRTISCVMSGVYGNRIFNVVGADEASVGKRDTPENVVQVAIRSLQAKKCLLSQDLQTIFQLKCHVFSHVNKCFILLDACSVRDINGSTYSSWCIP